MKKKDKAANKFYDDLVLQLAGYYNKAVLNHLERPSLFQREVIGYRKVKEPRYLKIKLPVIERHYHNDWEYMDHYFEGWLITLKEFTVCRIGTRTVEEPIYRRQTRIVRFRRYGNLAVNDIQKLKRKSKKCPRGNQERDNKKGIL